MTDDDPSDVGTSQRWLAERAAMRGRYFAALHEIGSSLVANADVAAELEYQFDSVADAAAVAARIIPEAPAAADPSEMIGRSRAAAGIHPTQSLQAAVLIFDAALPALAELLAERGEPTAEITAARLLNAVILNRMGSASRAYGDYLLDKAHGSNRDERRWLSRELHDVAAPSVAVALQKLELYELYRDTDAARAEVKLREMRESLLSAVQIIRSLSAQMRDTVARHGLATAIGRLLDDVPEPIHTDLTIHGDLEQVSLAYREEFFLIARESVRNAVSHAEPARIEVHIVVTHSELRARIVNDGNHFDVDAVLDADRHVGLDSMRERAALLGANLTIASSAAAGTVISIVIPLAGPTSANWPRNA
jgi:signal transduction histidine kinase